ncbi:hypothetical protein [Acetobacter sp. AAB5]|uniref:hypothetical protein n=1 Tax=Acetobacter sp. AAB5 TaxID=3418370 RepID=UPI003CFA5595
MGIIYFKKTHENTFVSLRKQFIENKQETEEDYQEPNFGNNSQYSTLPDQNPVTMQTTNASTKFSNTDYVFVPVSDELASYLSSQKFPFSTGTPKIGNL